MKTRLIYLPLLFSLNVLRAETVTLFSDGRAIQTSSSTYTNTYSVTNNSGSVIASVIIRTGEVVKVLYAGPAAALGTSPGFFKIGSTSFDISPGANTASFVGPATLTLVGSTNAATALVTAQITRNDEPFVPSGALFVPADSSGPVKIILESSTNLSQWASSLPGTYGATAQNQYFRVRAERQ